MKKVIFIVVFFILISACPVLAQEIYFHNGVAHQSALESNGYAWGLTYSEGFGEFTAGSLTYLNEGHVTEHKRDGLAPQIWERFYVFGRRVSLAAGIGPYLYSDTVSLKNSNTTIEHGIGAMASLAATLYTESPFLVQARVNWIWTHQNVNAFVATIGIGYQFDIPHSMGPLKESSSHSDQASEMKKNEIMLLAGASILNRDNTNTHAESFEYRRNVTRYFDWTIGWLNEGGDVSRNGLITQVWAGRSFLNNDLSVGFGVGPYIAYDTHGDCNSTKLNWIVGPTVSYQILPQWALRIIWNRVISNNDCDSDVLMAGIGYRF